MSSISASRSLRSWLVISSRIVPPLSKINPGSPLTIQQHLYTPPRWSAAKSDLGRFLPFTLGCEVHGVLHFCRTGGGAPGGPGRGRGRGRGRGAARGGG